MIKRDLARKPGKGIKARQPGESFMTYLERLRKARFMTQTELASKVGVVPSAVSFWESGAKEPSPKNYKKLARVLGISGFELTTVIEPDEKFAPTAK